MSMIGGVAGLLWSVGGCFDIVHYGEAAVKKRMGSFEHTQDWNQYYTFPPYVEPMSAGVNYGLRRKGVAFSFPFIDRWIRVSTLPNADDELKSQQVQTNKGKYAKIDGMITWQVMDDDQAIYRAIKSVNTNRATDVTPHLKKLVIARAGSQVVATMSKRSIAQMEDLPARQDEFLERCADKLSPLSLMGVSVDSITLENPYITDADRALRASEIVAGKHLEASREIAAAHRYAADTQAEALRELATAVRESGPSELDILSAIGFAAGFKSPDQEPSPTELFPPTGAILPFPISQREAGIAEGQF